MRLGDIWLDTKNWNSTSHNTVENVFPESILFLKLIIRLPNQYAGNSKVEILLGSLAKQIGASSCILHGQHIG